MGIGPGEWVIILLIVVILFGGSRFASLGASLGKGIREFRKAMSGEDETKEKKDSDKTGQAS